MGVRADSLADFELEIRSETEMVEFGKQLSASLKAGDVVALYGELGAGKTVLARGILRGLGYDGDVVSPTFNLVFEYPTEPPVLHADLYRLKSEEEVLDLGLFEPETTSVCLIEWPERTEGLLPVGSRQIFIKFTDNGRIVTGKVRD